MITLTVSRLQAPNGHLYQDGVRVYTFQGGENRGAFSFHLTQVEVLKFSLGKEVLYSHLAQGQAIPEVPMDVIEEAQAQLRPRYQSPFEWACRLGNF